MNDANTSIPYKQLGGMLRRLREQHLESTAEVSGAVEIEENDLSHIESGKVRPSQDILLLLISHFGIEEDRAAELWHLAGYENRLEEDSDPTRGEADFKQRPQQMMVMIDPRIMYSDSVEVTANQQGVVMSFSQIAGQETGPLTISRIGMSHDQAKAVMGVLHQVLYNRENPGNTRRLEGGPEKDPK